MPALPLLERGHTHPPLQPQASRPARRRAVRERRLASNRPNECCSCAFFRFNSLETVWIRSMADIQLKTVRSRSQLYCRHQKRSLTVCRLLTTPGTLLQSRSVTVTRLTMSSTVALRPRERPTPSKARHHCAFILNSLAQFLLRCVAFKKAYTSLCPIMWVRSFAARIFEAKC